MAGAPDQPEASRHGVAWVEVVGGPVVPLLELLPTVAQHPRRRRANARVGALGDVDGEGLRRGARQRVREPLEGALRFDPVGGGVRLELRAPA